MSARSILALEIFVLASTAINAILIVLFHRFTTSEFRNYYFVFPEFWGVVLTLACAAIMVLYLALPMEKHSPHLHHIVRMNFILLVFLVPIMWVAFPLSLQDWHRYVAMLAFLMTLSTPLWELVYEGSLDIDS